ncbi:propionate/acetate kinase, partial [Enterobacter hormaechei]
TFVHRITRTIGAHVAALKRFDGVIFTGGIGENSILIRRLVAERLRVFGIEMDVDKNNQPNRIGERVISCSQSPVNLAVIPTNEEKMIALDALHLGRECHLAEYV